MGPALGLNPLGRRVLVPGLAAREVAVRALVTVKRETRGWKWPFGDGWLLVRAGVPGGVFHPPTGGGDRGGLNTNLEWHLYQIEVRSTVRPGRLGSDITPATGSTDMSVHSPF